MSRTRDVSKLINGIAADKITSGTFADARLSSSSVTQHVDLSSIDSDYIQLRQATADLTNLNASNLTSGTIPNARYGTPTFNGSNLTNMSVSSSTGSFTLGHSHVSLSVNSARYIKIGRICTVHFYGYNTSTAGSGGDVMTYFTGLPFTSWNSGNVVGGGNMSYRHRYGTVGGWNIVITNNSTRMYIRYDGADDNISTGDSQEMMKKEDWGSSNKYFVATATYITAS